MDAILSKVFSARFLVVVILTVVFGYCTIYKIDVNNAFISIYGMAVAWYFTREDRPLPQSPQQNISATPTDQNNQ